LILASKVFGKGVDIREVSLIVDATGLPSRDAALQRHGRGVRLSEKRKELLYIDISDVGNRYEAASFSRLAAWRETGSPIISYVWQGSTSDIFKDPK
jgi:superfamily II DNA or RNA helicase